MIGISGTRSCKRAAGICLLGLVLLITAGCGGGGGGGGGQASPSALSYASPQMYPVGTAIQALKPQVTGTVTSYNVSPALPAGLTLDAVSGAISGTPTTPSAAASYTVTAQNSSGSTIFSLSLSVIAVNVSPANISRIVASGTAVSVAVSAVPVDFAVSGSLFAKATDNSGVFAPAVTVIPAKRRLYADAHRGDDG